MIPLGYYYGILIGEIGERGECGTEHGVGGDERMPAGGVEFRKPVFHRCYVGEYAPLRQVGEYSAERVECIFYRSGVDDEFRLETVNLIERGEAERVEAEAEPLGIRVVDGDFMGEGKQIAEE